MFLFVLKLSEALQWSGKLSQFFFFYLSDCKTNGPSQTFYKNASMSEKTIFQIFCHDVIMIWRALADKNTSLKIYKTS